MEKDQGVGRLGFLDPPARLFRSRARAQTGEQRAVDRDPRLVKSGTRSAMLVCVAVAALARLPGRCTGPPRVQLVEEAVGRSEAPDDRPHDRGLGLRLPGPRVYVDQPDRDAALSREPSQPDGRRLRRALQPGYASGLGGLEQDVPLLRLVVRAVDVRRVGLRLAGMARVALTIVAALFGVGCGSGDERPVERSAFLGDVSQLEPGKGDEPSLLYISPTADFSAYERVVIDPVTVWHASGSSPDRLPGAELRALAERFESAIRTRMQASIFEVVDEPRAGTLRIRAALTEGGRGQTKLDLARAHVQSRTPTGISEPTPSRSCAARSNWRFWTQSPASAWPRRSTTASSPLRVRKRATGWPATPWRGATSRRSSTLARAGSLRGSPHSTSSALPNLHDRPRVRRVNDLAEGDQARIEEHQTENPDTLFVGVLVYRRSLILVPLLALALGNTCATMPETPPPDLPEPLARAFSDPEADAVRHVVERRCMVCHACYDAPCQLVLSSRDGLARGANKHPVYDAARLLAATPTRLGIDAQTPEAVARARVLPGCGERLRWVAEPAARDARARRGAPLRARRAAARGLPARSEPRAQLPARGRGPRLRCQTSDRRHALRHGPTE